MGLLNAAMLAGLAGALVPVIIHFWNRSRDPVVDWGAMRFLDPGQKARRRLRLTELLLLVTRAAVVAAAALAMARPYVSSTGPAVGARPNGDLVIVIDTSAGMDRASSGTTPRVEAIALARRLVDDLGRGGSVAVLGAGDRVRPVVAPATFDKARASAALDALAKVPARGSSDLPAAIAEAFRLLERSQGPSRDVVVLTDGQRSAWRPGEAARWALLRDIQARMTVPPRTWAVMLGPDGPAPGDPPNAGLGPLSLSRSAATPGLPVSAVVEATNQGPGALTRTADLLVDGRPVPGSAQVVGPLPVGGRARLSFRAAVNDPGAHLLTARLSGGADAVPADDEASAVLNVGGAVRVLIVDGEPGRGPFDGEAAFLKAALAPEGDDAPRTAATVVDFDRFAPDSLRDADVLVLANVPALTPDLARAVARFLGEGGGVLVAPGDRVDRDAFNGLDWAPATLGLPESGRPAARPAPSTFSGPAFGPFGQGESPPLGSADLYLCYPLEPRPGASVSARLDNGAPWAVERAEGRGRVLLLAGPLDAEGGTLPVNPDFVPIVHEWASQLAWGAAPVAPGPGEPIDFEASLPATTELPPTLAVTTPSGAPATARASRSGNRINARLDDAPESGVYRLSLPDPPGGLAYAVVPDDGREADPDRLEPEEAEALSRGWSLAFEPDPALLPARLADLGGPGARREVWRGLVLLALAGLCVEIVLTRRLARGA